MLLLLQMILSIWILLNRVDAKPPPGYEKPPEEPDKDPPKYEYSYSIENLDERTGHGKLESRDGELALGRYFVQGDTSRQNVQYIADDWGFHPLVEYSNKHSRAHFALGKEAVNALKNSNKTLPQNQQIQGRNDENFENSIIVQTQAVIQNHNQVVHENEINTERYISENNDSSDDENLQDQELSQNQDQQRETQNQNYYQNQYEENSNEQLQGEYKNEEQNHNRNEEQIDNTSNNEERTENGYQNQRYQIEDQNQNEEQTRNNTDKTKESQIEHQKEENNQENTEVESIKSETIKLDNDVSKENEIKEDSTEKPPSSKTKSSEENDDHDDYYDNTALYENNEKILLIEQQNEASQKYQYLGEFGAKLKPKITKLIENTKHLISGEDVLNINEAIAEFSTEISVTENTNKSEVVTPFPSFVLTDRSSDGETNHVSLSKQPIVVADYDNEDEHVQAGSENFEETRQRDEALAETSYDDKDKTVDTTESGTVLVTPKPLSTTFLAGLRLENEQAQEITKNEQEAEVAKNETELEQQPEIVTNEQQHGDVQNVQKQNTFVEVQHSVPYYLGKFEYPSLFNTEVDVKESNNYKIEGAIQNIELGKTLINFPVNSFSEQIQHNNLQSLYNVQQLPVVGKNQPFNINDQLQESDENSDVIDATNPEGQASVAQPLIQTQIIGNAVPKQNHDIAEKPVEVTKSVPFPVIQQQYPIPVQVSVPAEKNVDKPVPLPHFIENPVEKNIPQYIEKPYPIEVKIPVPVPQAYYVPVEVPKPYPVEVTKYVANPYPVPQPYPVKIMEAVGVPVAQPVPYEVRVPHPVPVEVPKYIEKIVDRPYPVYVTTKNQKQQKFYYAPAYLPAKHCDQAKSHSNFYLGMVPPPKHYEQNHYNIQHHHHQQQQQSQHQPQIRKFRNPRSNFNSQSIRLEYGFMPPLIPSLEIDEFGNPINKDE